MRTYTSIPKSGKLYDAMQNNEAFKDYCLSYGEILSDIKTETTRGSERFYSIKIQGLTANIEMLNGEVTEWGISAE